MGNGIASIMTNFIVCNYVIMSRKTEMGRSYNQMEECRSVFKNLIGIPTGKRLLGRPKRVWQDQIRMDLKK